MCHSTSIMYSLYNLSVLCIAILHGCPSLHRGILIWLSFTRGPTVYVGAPQEWMFPSIDTDIIQQIIIGIEECSVKTINFFAYA